MASAWRRISSRSRVISPSTRTQAGSGKGLAPDYRARQTQPGADRAHLVLEKFAQRLDQAEPHARGQTADVVVALDQRRGVVPDRDAFDDVRIERALAEKVGVADRLQRLLEHLNEGAADDLAFAFGVADALEPAEEQRGGVGHAQVDVKMFLVEFDHRLALAEAQQTVVDEHTGELAANGLLDEGGRHGRIHAAAEAEDDAPRTDRRTDLPHRLGDEVFHRPVLPCAADRDEKVTDHLDAALGVKHLGMKLDAVEVALQILNGRKRRILGDPDGSETGRQLDDPIAMRIPNAEPSRETGEKPAGTPDRERAVAVLAVIALRGGAPQQVTEGCRSKSRARALPAQKSPGQGAEQSAQTHCSVHRKG